MTLCTPPIVRRATRPSRVLFHLALVASATGGCGFGEAGDDMVDSLFLVEDSAGVTNVSNAAPDRPLELREVLRIGAIDGDPDYLFQSVRSLTVDPDGGLLVVDSNEGVRRYGPDGDYVGSYGSRGDGPGESEMYYSATLDHDRVLLLGVPGVLQLFDEDGTLVSSMTPSPTGGFVSPVGAVDGTWILQRRGYAATGSTVFRGTQTFLRADSLRAPPDTVRTFVAELNREAGGGAVRHVGRASWFHGNPAFAVDGRGRIFVSDSLRYRIETYDLDGELVRVLERDAEPRAFDPAWIPEMEAGFESAQQQEGQGGRPIDRDRLAEQMGAATPDPVPTHLHFIESLLVGPGGELWVERADAHPRPPLRAVAHHYGYVRHAWLADWAAPQVFDVFDADGRYRGTVHLPDNVAPMAIAGDRLYGVLYDELDVEYVVVYEVSTST